MHIAIDGSSWENERGFGRFTRNLVRALAARDTGFRYSILLDQHPARPVPENVDIIVAGVRRSMAQASSGKSARLGGDILGQMAAARRIGCDVFFYPAVYSYFPWLSRRSMVVCFHDTIPERFPDLIFPRKLNFRLWQAKCWLAKKQATRVMTISAASARDLTYYLRINPNRIDIITEGADAVFRPISDKSRLTRMRSQNGIGKSDPLLVYVGGFNRHKNVIRLIKAMPAILDHFPNAKLAIVGRTRGARFWDDVDELQYHVQLDLRLTKSVIFTGEIEDNDLAVLLSAADALVFPSLMEGFGLPALEAMTCSTPVLSSDRGNLPEVVGDGGLYFDPESSADLAAKAVAFLGDADLKNRLSQNALKQAATFSWDKGAALAEACFLRAAGQDSP